MSAQDQSIGQELIRIIRSEIRAYDERKDEALRLRKVADEAVASAERAHANMRDAKPNSIHDIFTAALSGDLNAQAIDALFQRQAKPHVDVTFRGNKFGPAVAQAPDELWRNQQKVAEKTTARGAGENLPRRRWWARKKR